MKKLFAALALLSLLVPCFGQGDPPDPGIAIEPQSQTAPAGSSITLTVTASGTAPFNYQWWDSAGAIPDATNAIYNLDPAEPNESDNYTVTINNAFGSITSSVATVSIGLPPSISVQPMGQTAVAGSALTLSVTASGTEPLNYQWWNSGGAIPDATNAIYNLDPAETNESDNYTVTINNAFGSITSSVATVTIGLPPSISVQPMGQTVAAGSSLTLSVTASGTEPLTYQWWNSAGIIPDATNVVFALNPAVPDDYTVIINNDFGSITSSVATITIGLPPSISVQPVGQTLAAGSSITLTVTASGTAPFNYQWWDSAGAIPDATNAIYNLDPAEPNESDNYTVTINNAFGSITSSVATVTIGLPPSISIQPMGQTVAAGSSLTLSVVASGTAPLTYQWWNSGGVIPDATNAVFILNPAVPDDYTVIIENDFGSITSDVATVTIGLPPSISVQPMGQTVAAGSSLTLSVTASGTEPLTYQWWNSAGIIPDATNVVFALNPAVPDDYTVIINNDFGSITSSVATVAIGLPPSISVQPMGQTLAAGSSITLTVTASGTEPLTYQWWNSGGVIQDATNAIYSLNPAETNESDNYTVTINNDFGSITSSVATVTIGLPPSISIQPMGQTVAAGSSLTLSVVASGTAPLTYQWWNSGGVIPDATNAVFILNPAVPDDYTVIIENDFGSITSDVATVTIGLPPSISVQPMGQTVAAGSSLILSVTASGTEPLTYQWWNSAGVIPDATNAVFILNPAVPDDYTVTINNDFGSITSSVATVTIGLQPSISIQPVGQTVASGSSLTLSVMASGTEPLNYQWWNSTGSIPDATNAVFILNPAETNESDDYTVIIDNDFGSITSSVATVTIGLPPSISVQPVGQTVAAGSSLTLSVTASGTEPLNYQWWNSTGSIPDATNANYNLNPAETNESDNYTVTINNDFGSITSSVASVTIGLPPSISVEPVGQTVAAGSSLTLSVTASGTEPLTYQWSNSAGVIQDATNANYSLNPAETNESDNYTVTINNGFGSITSSVASVTIGLPPSISVQPMGQAVAAGETVVLSVTANGTGPLSYQWQLNGTNLPNALITTVAGNGIPAYNGDGIAATNAGLNIPDGLALDALGDLYIADTGNQRVRKVDTNNLISTVAGNGVWGYSGDGGAATNANFLFLLDVAISPSGQLLVADQDNHRIRQVDTNGIITTVVGNGALGNSGDGGAATNASLSFPHGLAIDSAGNLFIADSGSGFIRRVDTNGIITTTAGNGGQGYSGDGGAATNASLKIPTGVAVDGSGNLFIADSDNNCIRKVDTRGIITTVAGNGLQGYSGDGAAATNASLNDPTGVAVDTLGNLFIADSHNSLVRQVDSAGIISTIAGNYVLNQYNFVGGYSGDGGAATNASLFYPYRVVLDTSGDLFIADLDNNRIRQVVLTTEPAITIHNLNTNNEGDYTVVVSNAFGSITSGVATATIGPPSIFVQPMGQTAVAGSALTLSVTAAGTAPLNYQWWDSAGAIADATNAIYNLDPAEPDESDNYTVTINNAYGSITSSVVTVTIGLPPSISVQPMGQTVAAGSSITLTVTASGTAPLNYQWWDSGGSIQDATNAVYSLNPAEPDESDDYTVTINNAFGSITSSVASVSIDLPPSISVQPMGQMVVEGSNVTFCVVATGGDLHYQWYGYGGNDSNLLNGATNASLTVITAGEGSQVYDILVVVTNLAGEVASSNASLTVLTVLTGPINPYSPGTLGYDLFQSTFTLASSTNRTASYDSPSSNLGTNSAVWTWPVNLSCVGSASDFYQTVLIASNELLTCAHDDGEAGQTVTFHDTNGVCWVGVVTNVINVLSDLDISQLSNSAPASIVIPYILPPDYGSYIAGNSLLGMPAFWPHRANSSIDYAPVAWVGVANLEGGAPATWMQLIHNGYGAYSGTTAIGGDSGDPGFMSLSNKPVLLFALDLTDDAGGAFVSGPLNWYWLSALGLTNGLNILDLSGYPLQSAAPPTPDYNYIVPPTNQLASPGTLVTFGVSVCVFNASPFAYQWQWNGTNLAGATNAVLAFRAAPANAGNYSVMVSNELGSVTVGATLTLTSNQLPQILAPIVIKGQFQFGFNTISNNTYSVQYEDSLTSGNWVVLTNFTGAGAYWQTPRLPLVTQRFYRFVTSSP